MVPLALGRKYCLFSLPRSTAILTTCTSTVTQLLLEYMHSPVQSRTPDKYSFLMQLTSAVFSGAAVNCAEVKRLSRLET